MPARILCAFLAALLPAALAQDVSGVRMRADLKFLASDLLEGRAPGARGGALAEEYIAAQMAIAGLKPAFNGSYFQPVPLIGVETLPSTEISLAGERLAWLAEIVGHTYLQRAEASFAADVLFAGHGIEAPEYKWDDWAGADPKGKLCLMFTNEPAGSDPKFFEGPALTYYGRWTYKFEQAARKGCAAALLIHTDETAGYGWSVVRGSWGREESFTKNAAGSSALAFAGWITIEAADRILARDGKNAAELLAAAGRRGFRAQPLRIRAEGRIQSRLREFAARNVAGIVEGHDPVRRGEAVVFSAHADHLGIDPNAQGDGIYNGAVDNASGVAVLLEMARAWARLEPAPARSAIFLATAAEEAGLLGAETYAVNPPIPLAKTALNLNFDSFYPAGRVRDVILDRAERTTLWPFIEKIAARYGLTVKPDPRPQSGGFFRSDHFAFAKAGVAAFSVKSGSDFTGDDAGRRAALLREYGEKHYHQPSDEYRDDWDFASLEDIARLGIEIGLAAANNPPLTTWK
jgi:Zn-dependent M28 family amino/carboxypeptidase